MDETTRLERLRALPSIDELLARPSITSLLRPHSRAVGVSALRDAVASVRTRILAGEDVRFDEREIELSLARLGGPRLKPVINATGVVLHTNLGRAPLSAEAVARVAQIAAGYSNLELDLDEGERGSRYAPVVELLRQLTGAEDALVVNNCAAAVLLAFGALAKGREAIVSRGELVEIGGGFRIPDVMEQSGATLVEVGTTNRTRVSDYERAITERTGLLARIHRSNFGIVGFTEEATVKELAALGRARGVPTFVDVGSGLLRPLHAEGVPAEPTVSAVIAAGADLVSFSGDKLLGGPQAGIVVGRAEVIEKLKRHPLNRALRVDKMTVAALEATLESWRDEREDELPVRRALQASRETLSARAQALSQFLTGVPHRVVEAEGRVGGGSLPLATLNSFAVALSGRAAALHEKLRVGHPPVMARVVDDEVWLDVRCLADTELEALARAVRSAM